MANTCHASSGAGRTVSSGETNDLSRRSARHPSGIRGMLWPPRRQRGMFTGSPASKASSTCRGADTKAARILKPVGAVVFRRIARGTKRSRADNARYTPGTRYQRPYGATINSRHLNYA